MYKFTASDATERHKGLSESLVSAWVKAANAVLAKLISQGKVDDAKTQGMAAAKADAAVKQSPSAAASESVYESLEGVGATVDTEANVIRGVKVIGTRSKNGRDYPPAVLQSAVAHYEGVAVNIDHPAKPGDSRSIRDRFGVIRNASFKADGVYGDLHFNPKHSVAEQVTWAAKNDPSTLGLSHNAGLKLGKTAANGRQQVESIQSVRSVDLVANPATTNGFFEQEDPFGAGIDEDVSEGLLRDKGDVDRIISAASSLLSDLQYGRESALTPAERKSRAIEIANDIINEFSGNSASEGGDVDIKTLTLEELRTKRPDLITALESEQSESSELEQLRAVNATLLAEKQAHELTESINSELIEAGLNPADEREVSPAFRKQLERCESIEERAELITDRVAVVGESDEYPVSYTKPVTAEQAAKKPKTTPVTESHKQTTQSMASLYR
jgi:hypothetical protein